MRCGSVVELDRRIRQEVERELRRIARERGFAVAHWVRRVRTVRGPGRTLSTPRTLSTLSTPSTQFSPPSTLFLSGRPRVGANAVKGRLEHRVVGVPRQLE